MDVIVDTLIEDLEGLSDDQGHTMADVNDNLRAFREWRSEFQPEPDAHAYLSQHLDISSAVIFARLLAPELVLVRGCVILKDAYDPENFERWWQTVNGDTVRIEAVLNHLHLWDVFEPDGEEDERALESLANLVARSWDLHASRVRPDRTFRVEVMDDYGPTIVMTSSPKDLA